MNNEVEHGSSSLALDTGYIKRLLPHREPIRLNSFSDLVDDDRGRSEVA